MAGLVAIAAGAISFFSPCCVPLVPGYLAYVAGLAGQDAQTLAQTLARRPPGHPATGRRHRSSGHGHASSPPSYGLGLGAVRGRVLGGVH
ncbi:MAG: cytochrome c biogenesis protein CcdA [Nocardioidaceae bacterium]